VQLNLEHHSQSQMQNDMNLDYARVFSAAVCKPNHSIVSASLK